MALMFLQYVLIFITTFDKKSFSEACCCPRPPLQKTRTSIAFHDYRVEVTQQLAPLSFDKLTQIHNVYVAATCLMATCLDSRG